MVTRSSDTTSLCYSLSLLDALPIWRCRGGRGPDTSPGSTAPACRAPRPPGRSRGALQAGAVDPGEVSDRKSTRLNSSHANISYAVFCLKKKKTMQTEHATQ